MNKNTASLLNDANKAADGLKHGVKVLAITLAEYMEKMHGGEWRTQIDHEAEFVMIARCAGRDRRPIAEASLREAI